MTWTLPAEAWPTVAAMLELTAEAWPESLALHDLAFLHAEVAAGERPRYPGRGFLADRWSWTPHQVRRFLDAPARRQPGSGPTTALPTDPVITEPAVTSGTPARPAEPLTRAFRALGLEAPAPGAHQPGASPGMDHPGLSAVPRQPDASPAPARPDLVPPHTPPPDPSLPDPDPPGDRSIEGVQGETLPPRLARPAQELPEARAFLATWTRWRHHPRAPHRWTGGPAEALTWFLELLASGPDTEIGKALAALDVVASLEAWDGWLGDRADEHGKPGTASRSKFPKAYKAALRTWFINQVKFGRNLKAKAQGRRRGAWAGRATPFTTPGPAPTTPTPDLAPPAPGDLDALDRF